MGKWILPFALVALIAAGSPVQGQRLDAGQDIEVVLTERDCRALVAHTPTDDVAYQPGRDVRGRPVAPADLGSGPVVPDLSTIRIPLTLSLGDVFVLPPAIDADIPLWTLTVEADGRTYLDGQPLHDDAAAQVARICRERFGL